MKPIPLVKNFKVIKGPDDIERVQDSDMKYFPHICELQNRFYVYVFMNKMIRLKCLYLIVSVYHILINFKNIHRQKISCTVTRYIPYMR